MTDPESSKSPDEDDTFDMYHFFSRIDMILASVVIILLLLAALYYFYVPGAV